MSDQLTDWCMDNPGVSIPPRVVKEELSLQCGVPVRSIEYWFWARNKKIRAGISPSSLVSPRTLMSPGAREARGMAGVSRQHRALFATDPAAWCPRDEDDEDDGCEEEYEAAELAVQLDPAVDRAQPLPSPGDEDAPLAAAKASVAALDAVAGADRPVRTPAGTLPGSPTRPLEGESADESEEGEEDEGEMDEDDEAEPAPAEEAEDSQSWRPEVWEVGYLCDGLDQYRSPWCVVKVIEVEGDRVKIHFQGWAARWEEWVEVSSDRLAPHKTKSTKEARAKVAAEKEAARLAAEEERDVAKARAKAEREAAKAAAKRRAAEERLAAQVMSLPHAQDSVHAPLALSYTLSTWYICF
jgi:hypothetical protein